MLKRMLLMLGGVLLIVLTLAGYKFLKIKQGMAQFAKFSMMPPAAVTSIIAAPQTWQPVLSVVGSMRAVNGVLVSTDLAGIVSQIAFESGRDLKKGDLLVRLDTQQEQAQLHSAQARRELARISLQRQQDLFAKKAVAQSDFDAAQSEFRQADAAVEEAQAMIARKTITAPFDGLAGIRQVDLGQYLNVGSTIAPLQSLDPIYVEFTIPQQNFTQIVPGKKIHVRADGIEGQEFDGQITAIDSKVDETTRNVTIQGTVRNPGHKLRPGMYVNVDILLPEQPGVIAIPATSINYAPYGDSVFIIKDAQPSPDGTKGKEVVQQFVKLGATRGDQVAILTGVKPGDEVVTSGVFKLRSHTPVMVNNSVKPDNSLNPNPPDT
jgi:membrane fusion protein (multidrug efflux system)